MLTATDPGTKSGLHPLGQLIFYDRYSVKTQVRTNLIEGQLVVVCLDPTSGQRELARVLIDAGGDDVTVTLGDNETVKVPRLHLDVPTEGFGGAKDRIASAVASAEEPVVRTAWSDRFREILGAGDELPRFVPAGRIWAGAGVEEALTPFNCFVIPPPADARHGIVETLDRMLEIMSRGGGVGIPLMSLRPQHALVRGVNGRSSGATKWSQLYSFGTGLIEQGGSRRGALMLIQYVWHPDILSFIEAKKTPGVLENANLSVAITDAFMEAVRDDRSWDLIFPETDAPGYDAMWDGDIEKWRANGGPVRVYQSVRARDLWDTIVQSAWASAEPGLFFVDRYNALSNSYYYPQGRIWCTNPCGEQGLPGWGVCNLGHLNLPRFLIGDGIHEPAQIDWELLRSTIHTAVRFMDDLLDIAHMPFPENVEQQRGERRVGLGTMGLGELLIRSHVTYGNNGECLALLDKLFGFIAEEAYLASTEIAVEKGSFPWFEAEPFLNSGFAKTLPTNVRAAIRKSGLRNVTLLTQAPTGTVGTMMGTSTGIEPCFAWVFERMGRLGTHMEAVNVYAEYLAAHPEVAERRDRLAAVAALRVPEKATPEETEGARKAAAFAFLAKSNDALPPWFVNTYNLSPSDHSTTQAAIQRWVDSSISKTSNLPNSYTPAQVGAYYEELYALGAKGGTVYRDGSRSMQVLSVGAAAPEAQAPAASEEVLDLLPVPIGEYDLKAKSVQTPLGKLSVKLGVHPDTGEFFEAWLDLSKGGTDVAAFTEALARVTSVCLRLPSPMSPTRRLHLIANQLEGIGGADPWGFGANKTLSVPDGVSKAIRHLAQSSKRARDVPSAEVPDPGAPAKGADVCPNCHQASLLRVEGCSKCSCGYSKC